MDVEKLMSAEDLAAFLQVPKQTVYGWRYEGKGPPSMKVGKYLRYRRADVERWLDQMTLAS